SCKKYPLDNLAIIHLAVRQKGYTNSFRLTVTLKEEICPKILQAAVDAVTPRFPTIAAEIRKGFFKYFVVPVQKPPEIIPDTECLADMGQEMIEQCALRVLYEGKRISVEIFHSLTDGYGGLVFLNTLTAEYLHRKYQIARQRTGTILNAMDSVAEWELADDYDTYAEGKSTGFNHRKVYQLPGREKADFKIQVMTGIYEIQDLLEVSHYYGVSLTAFLTAIMSAAVMETQREQVGEGKKLEPVQIMVPVNLRKKFASRSLRNFSLYAMSCMMPSKENASYDFLAKDISNQLGCQLSKECLKGQMATNVHLQKAPLLRMLPLTVKEGFLRLFFPFLGEKNSCLSISNMGEVSYSEEVAQYIERIEFMLTPRRNAPYNCGVVTYKGQVFISFTRKADETGFEKSLFNPLTVLGFHAAYRSENQID
ncbi:MAG: hypothetical protein K2K74_09275, partial [Lachnospiraceae bacterium]|nr:hypothetical protein [Lachnospiraceae bacterium]